MEYSRICAFQIDQLWEFQKAYKAEIGEDQPGDLDRTRLLSALEKEQIIFYGVCSGSILIGCCSVTVGFSTFDYASSGVFEDFYIRPEYRHLPGKPACIRRLNIRRKV